MNWTFRTLAIFTMLLTAIFITVPSCLADDIVTEFCRHRSAFLWTVPPGTRYQIYAEIMDALDFACSPDVIMKKNKILSNFDGWSPLLFVEYLDPKERIWTSWGVFEKNDSVIFFLRPCEGDPYDCTDELDSDTLVGAEAASLVELLNDSLKVWRQSSVPDMQEAYVATTGLERYGNSFQSTVLLYEFGQNCENGFLWNRTHARWIDKPSDVLYMREVAAGKSRK